MRAFIRGVSFRLAVVGVVLGFVLGLLMTFAQLYWDYQNEKEYLELRISQLIEQATPTVSRAVVMLDDNLAKEVVTGILTYDFISRVGILDEQGEVLAEGEKPPRSADNSFFSYFIPQASKDYRSTFSVALYGDMLSATLYFTVDQAQAMANLASRSERQIYVGFLRSLILVFLLFIAFHLMLARPLIRVSKEIQSINVGEPGAKRLTPFPGRRHDELNLIVSNSNQLLDAVDLALAKRRTVEMALRSSEEHIRQIIDSLPVMIGARDHTGKYIFVNEAMAKFVGLEVEQMKDAHLSQFAKFLKTSVDDILRIDQQVIKYGHKIEQVAEMMFTDSGHMMYFQTHYVPITFYNQPAVLSVSVDITSQKRTQERMEHMAFHDALTNLPNRTQLVDRLEHEISRARRHGYFGAVLFVDLDQFKTINDSLGHPVGDEVLKQVSRRLKSCIRDEDFVSRLSGDEFVIALTVLDRDRTTAALKAGEIGEKVRAKVAEPYLYDNIELRITASIGVAVYPDENINVHEILRYADTAMYQVKEKGRDAIEFFNEDMANRVSRQLAMEGDLHKALEEGQFLLFYQPKVDVKTGTLIGAEALLRWQHPDGFVSPADFIPVLETSGLIIDVGEWVLNEACDQLSRWIKQGFWKPGMALSVNVSPRQFRQKQFVSTVTEKLECFNIPAGALEIEITESIVIQNIDETIATMTVLASYGVGFSLDDFGTGYSSISYLKRLPVHALKIDQGFIRDILEDRSDRVLVETMITMGKLLGLDVIAEGVEHNEQLDLLKQFGCKSYQGYLFSRPVAHDEFVRFIS